VDELGDGMIPKYIICQSMLRRWAQRNHPYALGTDMSIRNEYRARLRALSPIKTRRDSAEYYQKHKEVLKIRKRARYQGKVGVLQRIHVRKVEDVFSLWKS
jgi:hypothetical protein